MDSALQLALRLYLVEWLNVSICFIVDEVKPSSAEYCQNRSTLVRFSLSAAPYPE